MTEAQFDIQGVRQVCLIRSPDGSPVLLASVGRRLPPAKLEQIDGALRGRIAALGLNGRIKRVVTVEDDLVGADGFKLCRARIAADFAEGRLTEARASSCASSSPDDPIYARVLELFSAALGMSEDEIVPDTDFFLDGGGSSLDYFALVSRLREDFSVDFPSDSGNSPVTPMALYRFISGGD